jgi:hypothetical protein
MNQKISVVIPTLGGIHLEQTIKNLNNGTKIPNEIILSLPKKTYTILKLSKYTNVKIIKTFRKGQVHQRIEGFKSAKYPLVLQLDDDILLNKYCLRELSNFLRFKKKVSVSPLLITKSKSSNFDRRPKNLFYKIYHFFLNGKENFKEGQVSKAGIPYYFDNYKKNNIYKTDWLSGGCILHKKENLILKNYFFIKSKKAYCEDLIHSHKLKKKKIQLYLNTNAKAKYDDFDGFKLSSLKDFYAIIKSDYMCRLYYVKLSKKSIIRMNLYYFFLIIRFFFTKIK